MSRIVASQPPLARVPQNAAVLTVQRRDGWATTYTLQNGRSVMIGRSTNCGLQLVGDNLAAIHCMMRLNDGELLLQDWFSSSGTLINGEPAHGEVRVPPGALIQIGEYELRVQMQQNAASPTSSVADSIVEGPTSGSNSGPSPAAIQQARPTVTALEDENKSLAEKLRAANEENKLLRGQLQELLDQSSNPQSTVADPFAQETIEMLRAELDQLQSELLHRSTASPTTVMSEDTSDEFSAETAQLVERMDDLLAELAQSDDRIASLEELLRVADEASEAEREERRQLESWVGDIERRIGARESDWKSEVEQLRARLAESANQQRQMEQRLAATAAASRDDQVRVQVESWQARIAELQQQLDDSEKQQQSLQQQVRDLQHKLNSTTDATQIDQALREERVRLAQERAELARARSEVATLRAQLQQQTAAGELTGRDGDQRMRAFREHLREIHNLEQAEQPRSSGLSSRIAKLWKRLDG